MITKEQITSAANADSAELLKQGVSAHTAEIARLSFLEGAAWTVEQTKGSYDALRAVISHLEAENAKLREALKECIELIDAFMVETLNQPFPTNNAPEIIRIAREILEK